MFKEYLSSQNVQLLKKRCFASYQQFVYLLLNNKDLIEPPVRRLMGSPRGVMARVLDCSLRVSYFELQSSYYILFRTYNPGERYEPLYHFCYRLNSISDVLLQFNWLWITHKSCYAIKKVTESDCANSIIFDRCRITQKYTSSDSKTVSNEFLFYF